MTDESKFEAAIESWEVAGAPPGFAERIGRREIGAVDPPSHARWLWGAGALAVAAAVLLVIWIGAPRSTSGVVDAERRTTVELPSARVVADAGARMEWSSDGTRVTVEHHVGRAFYRVDKGTEFAVLTPLGRIEVTGTSFEVEVVAMGIRNKNMKYAAGGVALAAAVTVGLYEGRVVVAGERGSAVIEPGHRATLRPGAAPEVSERTSMASLRDENRRLRDALEAQRTLTRARGSATPAVEEGPGREPSDAAEPNGPNEAEQVERCALTINGDLGCPMVQPSQAVLDRRADCGVVVYDRPRALESREVDFGELAELAGLDAAERKELEAATRSFHDEMRAEFEAIYTELGGDPALGAKLSAPALAAEIDGLRPAEEQATSYRSVSDRYSAVLAGRQAQPDLASLSPGDRHAYIWTAAGDLYEARLAEALGAARAAELRQATDGWTGNRGMQGEPHCPEQE